MDIYKIFANKTRNILILCLSDSPKNVGELIKVCGLSQSALSQHLSKLKSANLLQTKRQGKKIIYSLKDKKTADISRLLISIDKNYKK